MVQKKLKQRTRKVKGKKARGKKTGSPGSSSNAMTAKATKTLEGYNMTLVIDPTVIFEQESDADLEIDKTNHANFKELKQWYLERIQEQKMTYLIENETIKIIPSETGDYLFEIKFKVLNPSESEKHLAVESILKPDERMEHPIYLNENDMVSLKKTNEFSEAVYIKANKISEKIRKIWK